MRALRFGAYKRPGLGCLETPISGILGFFKGDIDTGSYDRAHILSHVRVPEIWKLPCCLFPLLQERLSNPPASLQNRRLPASASVVHHQNRAFLLSLEYSGLINYPSLCRYRYGNKVLIGIDADVDMSHRQYYGS